MLCYLGCILHIILIIYECVYFCLKDAKVAKGNTVTPKTKRRFDVLDDRTPLKDEILFCSQQFDSQSGIGWKDSYGSSSGRYVRLSKLILVSKYSLYT